MFRSRKGLSIALSIALTGRKDLSRRTKSVCNFQSITTKVTARTLVMKRKNGPSDGRKPTPAKKQKPTLPEYHASTMVKDEHGGFIWPAPASQMEHARNVIRACAQANLKTVICPDKDADGLTSGVILSRTLQLLGLSSDLIDIHLLQKGNTVHSQAEREILETRKPSYIFVLDQGSRNSPPLISDQHTALIIDHHYATDDDFPQGSSHVTACNSPPVATSSLLTYLLCRELHELVEEQCNWLAIVGTHGDLGTTLKWEAPFPDMSVPLKMYTKKTLNDVVSAVNAPRRTATYDVIAAWQALASAVHPKEALNEKRLREAREEVSAEVERCTHTAPKFSPDGRIAVFRISSECQVHPVIATRWAGHLNSKALEIVMVANSGYLEGKVNFSCRIARCARARQDPVDIIQSLKAYAQLPDTTDPDKPPLIERLGDDFARGHVQASGGIVTAAQFEELMALMKIGEKSEAQKLRESDTSKSPAKAKKIDTAQTNTLDGYFGAKR